MDVIALCVSLLALYVSARSTWAINFKPGRVVANVPYLVIWQFSSWKGEHPTGDVCNRYITPSIWLGNVGALPVVVVELRLRIESKSGDFIAYPVAKVGLDVVEDQSQWKGKMSLTGGGPMPGFVIGRGGEWRNEYAFSTKLEEFEKLLGETTLHVEIREPGKNDWRSVMQECFNFGTHPYHLQPLKFSNSVSGSTRSFVYSRSWHERRGE